MSQRESEAGSALVPVALMSSAESSGIHVGFFFDAGEQKRPVRIKLGGAWGQAFRSSEKTSLA
jgi:hypothetical protein